MQSWQSSSRKPSSLRSQGTPSEAVAATCLHIVDAGLLGVVLVAPLFLGGRDPLGRFLFITFACLTSVAWFLRQTLLKNHDQQARSWAYPLAFAALALVAAQLIPLPWGWLQQLAPRNSSLLTLWQGDSNSPAQLGVWKTLSLAPSATRLALATLVAYVLLFFTVVGRLQTVADIQRLMRLLAISAIAMSAFGLIQYFTSNGRFFWFYEYPFASTKFPVKGSFTCRNHFANYLVLGLGPLLAWIVLRNSAKPQARKRRGISSSNKPLISNSTALYAGLTLVVFAVLLSISRGGMLAMVVAGTIALVLYYRRGFISGNSLYGLAALGLLIVGMLSVYGYDSVASRLDDFASGSIDGLDTGGGRRKIWAANWLAIQQGGLFGSGAGSHREIYPIYLPQSLEIEFTHAENGYLQIATENGWLGAALLACALGLIGSWCWRANRHAPSREQLILAGAVTASLAASLVHSLVDFVWYIPACMSMTVLLLACALRLSQLSNNKEPQATRSPNVPPLQWRGFSCLGTAAAAMLAVIWAISTSAGPGTAATHWNQYRLASATNRQQSIQSLVEGSQKPSISKEAEQLTEVMIFHLRHALVCDPASATTHSRLASRYLQLFEQRQIRSDNAMTVAQIREAATASRFASAKALRLWLERAFGKNSRLLYQAHYHARRALQLCPLQGEAYLYLSNLCFLQGQTSAAIQAYIDQGLRLRPYNFNVVFQVGEQLSALGRDPEAIALWQRIFRDPGKHQLRIIQLLSKVVPAAYFLELFEPDWHTLHYVWQHYRQLGSEADWQTIAQYATTIAQRDGPSLSPNEAAAIWRSLAGMYKELGHFNGVLHCYQQAYRVAPTLYSVRRELGRTFLQLNLYPQAEPHLRWCLTRRPEDAALKAEMIHATKRHVAGKNDSNSQPKFQ